MDDKKENVMKTGTTTIGLVCKDGIVLAADKRATVGYMIAHKKTEKIHTITDNIAVTMAGTASDAQLLIRLAKSELQLKRIRTGREPSVKEAANLFARMVYANIRKMSLIPGISHFVLGGKDIDGFHCYDIFADGTVTEIDDFISSGSGSVFVYGVLETMYKKNMGVDDGVKLALKSLNAALQRDIASGDGYDIVSITKDGVKKVIEKEIVIKIE
ncbi:MAG TPA: proteasome subunit beta [Candidatus Nanoarchaeia archaeon]|nr:proteasome subunit beta [Candidatus Nanoarchaeia archaeon]